MRLTVSPYIAERITRTRSDFRVDSFRAGGCGGQRQNKVNSGVRITDIRTGIAVECREERDRLTNHKRAAERLLTKLVAHYEAEEAALRMKAITLVPTIRTYKEGHVLDHRTGRQYDLDSTLNGRLEPIVQDLAILSAQESLE